MVTESKSTPKTSAVKALRPRIVEYRSPSALLAKLASNSLGERYSTILGLNAFTADVFGVDFDSVTIVDDN
jgi:hypothetical protein